MSFRTKNLMLTVLPEEQEALGGLSPGELARTFCAHPLTIWFCPHHSCFPLTPVPCYTGNYLTFCPPTTLPNCIFPTRIDCVTHISVPDCPPLTNIACAPTTIPDITPTITPTIRTPIEQTIRFGTPETLAALQQQLAQLQEATKAQIDTLQAQQSPQTVEEAEMLEKHLTEALNEVKATKESLRRKSK